MNECIHSWVKTWLLLIQQQNSLPINTALIYYITILIIHGIWMQNAVQSWRSAHKNWITEVKIKKADNFFSILSPVHIANSWFSCDVIAAMLVSHEQKISH
jgi:hypothetical protein